MNIFLPTSIQTQIELEEIADVKYQIITPSTSRTIIGIVQDGLIGAYNLTSPNMRIDWKNAMNIMSYTAIDNLDSFKKTKEFTGYELFSMILPPRINVKKGDLLIKNGTLEKGYVTKDLLGAKKENNLTQLIWDEYGIEGAKTFLDNVSRLANNFNLFNGFTVGVQDAVITKEVADQIKKLFDTKELKVAHLVTELENNPDMMDIELLESTIYSEINVIREDVSKIMINNIDPTNNFGIMLNSGSKGDKLTYAQMGGCVGLQAFEGKLVPKKVNNRSLPYFHRDDDSPSARGLVKHPFIQGSSYTEFFFINMTGREGLIDQAIRTAQSGYIQRKLIKMLEDYMIKYDGTVRSAVNQIVQFVYGDSGADTIKQYIYKLEMLEHGDSQIEKVHKMTPEELKATKTDSKLNDEIYEMIIDMRDKLRITQIKTRCDWMVMNTNYKLPFNLSRIVNNYRNSSKGKGTLTAQHVIESFEKIVSNKNTMLLTFKKSEMDKKDSPKYKDDMLAKTAIIASLFDALSPKRSIIEYGLSSEQFDEIVKDIIKSFNQNQVEPGEMVGVIAAQSAGEPVTQLSCHGLSCLKIIEVDENNQIVASFSGYIKDFVDNIIDNKVNLKRTKTITPEDENGLSSKATQPMKNYHIVSVGENEKIQWSRILEVSRHPANGELVKVTTKSGRTTTATKSHSFLKRDNNKIVPVKGSDLKIGDRIPCARNIKGIDNAPDRTRQFETD